jgi:5,10-methylenetetrahydrofolate reductase
LRKDDVLVVQLQQLRRPACHLPGLRRQRIIVSPVPMQYRAHELSHVFATTGRAP